MKKIGLMGCGTVARYGHLPALKECEDLELFAIFDPFQASVCGAQEQFGVPHAFTNEEDFFASCIDAVTITSPAPCHLPNVLGAAHHRLPVLCEKPLAMDGEEAHQMTAAMEEVGVSLHAAFCYRFSDATLKIRELVAENAIGEVRSLRLVNNWNAHGKYRTNAEGTRILQARRHGRMLEGGPLLDCGTHQIDLAHFWLNSPVEAFTGRGAWVEDYEAPDHIWLHMDHASGAHTMIEVSYSYQHTTAGKRKELVFELIGTEGVIRYDAEERTFVMDNQTGHHEFDCGEEKNFLRLYQEWARALDGGGSTLLTSAEDGMRVVEIARDATNQAIAFRK